MRMLANLGLIVLTLCEVLAGQETHFQTVVTTSGSSFNVDLSDVLSTSGSTITVANNSWSPLAVPSISAPAVMPPLDRNAIVNFLRGSSSTDEAFAIAGWQYMVDHVPAGYCSAGTTSDQGGYTLNPMRMLYGYGFGCCDQQANALAWLWADAGYPVRIASLVGFHTIPEIYYGGAWHMLDPDHQVFYRNADTSIASVAQIIADPSVVANTHDSNGLDPVGWPASEMAQLYEQYAAALRYDAFEVTEPADPIFTLLPHESLQFQSRDPWPVQFYDPIGAVHPLPASLASAIFQRTIDFTNNEWQTQAVSWGGMQTTVQADGRQAVVSASGGTILFQKSIPFPILALQVTGEFVGNIRSGLVSVSFSQDGVNWSTPIPFAASDATGHASVNLTQVAQGAYSYYLRVQITGPGVGIYELPIRVDAQAGAPMFPVLVPGQLNSLTYQDLSPTNQPRNVEITISVPHGKSPLPHLIARSQVTESPSYSIARNYLAQNLVDGDPSTLAYPGSNYIDYIVSLGASYNVRQVSIWWRYFGTSTLYVNSWRLYGRSGQNSSWHLLQTGTYPNARVTDVAVSGLNLTDIRITASSVNWIGLYELQVYGDQIGPALSGSDVTVRSQVTESPDYSIALGYVASKLVDGNLNTLAYPGSQNIDYIVHLPTLSHVSDAVMQWGYFGTNPIYIDNWSLYTRLDEGEWVSAGSGQFPAARSTYISLDAFATDIRLTASSTVNWIGAYELAISASAPLQPIQVVSNTPYDDPDRYPLSNLTDGNDQTLAYPGLPFNDFQLDFGGNFYVDFINVNWGYFGTNSLYVQSWIVYGQTDGGYDWTPLAVGGFPDALQTVVSVKSSVRRLRIVAASSNWIGMYEVTAFGRRNLSQ